MKARIPLNDQHIPYLQLIHDAKRGNVRSVLDSIEETWLTRFEEYEDHFTATLLEELPKPRWSSVNRDALLHCYNSNTAALSELKTNILEAQLPQVQSLCPYCVVGTTEEFDHYVPKEDFPHVAVHALNLIPCCGRCNKKKSRVWLRAGLRQFLHFYVDEVPDEQYVFATVAWRNSGAGRVVTATYELRQPNGFSGTKFALIRRHFENLELLENYRRHTQRPYTEISRFVRAMSDNRSRASVRRVMKRWADTTFDDEGYGSWRGALALALREDNEFLNLMTTP